MTKRMPIGHWQSAARHWRQVGPPLRPARADLEFFREVVGRFRAGGRGPLRVLILGVTPEIYHLPWPSGTQIRAVDHAAAMIAEVWPGPSADAVCAEWTEMPLEDAACDLAFCDGGLHLLAHPAQQAALVAELKRVLVPGGLCVVRLFAPAPSGSPGQSPDQVLQELLAGRIADLNLLKFRLWMALHRSAAEGVALDQIWQLVSGCAASLDELAQRIGWQSEHLRAIEVYQGSPNRYHFLTSAEATELFCAGEGGFEPGASFVPTYALGEHCPTLVFRRRPGLTP
jgi:SAM-dependent methyltransferase